MGFSCTQTCARFLNLAIFGFSDSFSGTTKGERQSSKALEQMTLEVCVTLYEAALIREDELVLLEVNPSSPDLIVKEIYATIKYAFLAIPGP